MLYPPSSSLGGPWIVKVEVISEHLQDSDQLLYLEIHTCTGALQQIAAMP